jgi:5-methylcytosine-specific restriction endonuclease McrA
MSSKEYQKRYYQENAERLREYGRVYGAKYRAENADRLNNKREARRRAEIEEIFILLGNECCKCGFNDKRALQIDHIEPILSKIRSGSQYKRMIEEIKQTDIHNYQLLCANCHAIKTKTDRTTWQA